MSSLRNAVKRVTHKERSQPAGRSRLGLLEKHRDYILRARDYEKKKKRLKSLKLKAALRNPDEFYFAMHKETTIKGVHTKRTNVEETQLDNESALLLKGQDQAYVRMKMSQDEAKARKLRNSLYDLDAIPSVKRRHTVFVGSVNEASTFDPEKYFDTVPELVSRSFNRPRKRTLNEMVVHGALAKGELKKAMKAQRKSYAELEQREERARRLRVVATHLAAQRHAMGKGTKTKVKDAQGDNPAQYKWKQKRQR